MSKLVETFQADLPTRVFRVTNAFNEAVYLAANEPSLGMYRLQEHIQTNVPKVVQQKQTLQRVFQEVEGACYDLDYARETVTNLASVTHFAGVAQLLDSAIQLKEQLEAVESGPVPVQQQVPPPEAASYKPSNTQQTTDSLLITPKSFD